MDKNNPVTPQEKKENNRQIAVISILVVAVLLIADLYVMINIPGQFLALAVITILLLAGVYVFVNAILKEINQNKIQVQEQYDNIFKSEKASYILLKKAFEQLEELDSKSGESQSANDIITAQKAIAKVTISRSRENADALLNSNDKMMEKMFDFEEQIGNNHSELLEKQRSMLDDSMKELQQSIKDEFSQALQELKEMQPVAAEPVVDEPVFTEDALIADEPEAVTKETTLDMGPDLELDLGMDLGLDIGVDDSEAAEPAAAVEPEVVEEPETVVEPEVVEEPETVVEPEVVEEPETVVEPEVVEEPELDLGIDLGMDFGLDDSLDLGIDLLNDEPEDTDTVSEESTAAESQPPVAEESTEDAKIPEMPDLSEPNKLMTPDEIAALLANM